MALYCVLQLRQPLRVKYALVVGITTFWSPVFAILADRLPAPYRKLVDMLDRKAARTASSKAAASQT